MSGSFAAVDFESPNAAETENPDETQPGGEGKTIGGQETSRADKELSTES